MKPRTPTRLRRTAALVAGLLACACDARHDRENDGDRRRHSEPTAAPTSTGAPAPTADVEFVDAPPETYPQRAYYYDSSDADHVYFYDVQQPDAFTYRQVFRDRDRPYYLEHDGDRLLERRVFFDDQAARVRRVERPQAERAPLERTAREHDQRERDDWTRRRGAAPERNQPASQQRPQPAPQRQPPTPDSPRRDDHKDKR